MALFRALGDFVAVHIEPERRHGAGAAIQIRPEPRIAVPHARNQLGIGSMLKRTLPRRRKDSGRRDAHPPVGGASGFAHADRVPKLTQSPDDQGRRAEFSPAGFRMGHGNRAATPPALGAQRQARHAKKAKRKPT